MLSVPSKTFMLGEYLVVAGGDSILLATQPRFSLNVTAGTTNLTNIDLASPAGEYWQAYANDFQHMNIHFHDPHTQQGGFGASSAQFLLLHQLRHNNAPINNHNLLTEYQQFAWSGKGLPPSGGDVIGQYYGDITLFNKSTEQQQTLTWPFSDVNFAVLRTGNKLATHEHLQNLTAIPTKEFTAIVHDAKHALLASDSQQFCQAVNAYALTLAQHQLVAKHTQTLLTQLRQHDAVLAAKGCGALGADVILILYKHHCHAEMLTWLTQENYAVVYAGQQTSPGFTTQLKD